MDEDQWLHLFKTGQDLHGKYRTEGNPDDLSDAIDHLQKALVLYPHASPERTYSLNELGWALLARYEREGNLDDLMQAIAYHEEDLTFRPPGHPGRGVTLINLANAVHAKYEREGDLVELARVIEYRREALDVCSPGNPNHSICLNNLANALLSRYQREGELADLVQVIQLNQQALHLRPPGHPFHAASLSNLAIALQLRYEREGELEDLAQMIQLNQQALNLRPPGHPLRDSFLNNLATAIQARYKRRARLTDLLQMIQLNQEALSLRPPGHPRRHASLINLANAYEEKYEREKDMVDLVHAIEHLQQALDLCSPGHPLRSMSLNNIALVFQKRYEREGELADLDQMIQLHQEALDSRPPGNPDRSQSLRNLANTLFIKYKRPRVVDEPIQDSHSNFGVYAAKPPEHGERTSTEISKGVDPDSTLDAYISALQQLDIALAFGQSLDQRQRHLVNDELIRQTQGLGGDAATWALQRGELERAVELLEQGRTLLLAQVGRYRVELDNLRQVDSLLADRFADLSRQLDASIVSDTQVEDIRPTTNDRYGRYRDLSTEWDQMVGQIRMLPDFDTFLKPMPYDRLRKAAAEGPIVIIIPNLGGSDALIVREDLPPYHIHLPLANSYRLNELSANLTKILDPEHDGDVRSDSLCVEILRCLWIEIVQPVAHALQHDVGIPLHSRIWWCPTSAASFLPLHAAGLYSKMQPLENFPNLYISSYTTTLQALLRARRSTKATAPKKLLVVSQPHTPGEPPLNYAKKEADIILETVSPVQEVRMLSAEEGSCKDVQIKMESHPWVHFICHGVQAAGQPFDSYLSLYDGYLTLRNIIERNLPNADFAFLAACHSAAGDQALSNEGLHLAAAMQFAGFRGVIGTLWKMADDDGPPLAEAFYRDMSRHGDSRRAAVALSKAIKQLRRNAVPINRWIRFIHIGI